MHRGFYYVDVYKRNAVAMLFDVSFLSRKRRSFVFCCIEKAGTELHTHADSQLEEHEALIIVASFQKLHI